MNRGDRREKKRSSALSVWGLPFLAPLALCVAPVAADDVYLANGEIFEEVVTTVTATHVVVELPIGRIKLPRTQVARIVEKKVPRQEFAERRGALIEDVSSKACAWLALATWAERHRLQREAVETALLAARLDPGLSGLEALLHPAGFARDEQGRWASLDEIMRARGLVSYEGEWISPRERAARESERALAEARLLQERRAAAEARVAELRELRDRQREPREGEADEPSSNEVALASIRLAEKAIDRGRELGYGSGSGFFVTPQAFVIPTLPLSGGVPILIPEPLGTLSGADLQRDLEALVTRQPGSVLPVQAFVRPRNR
jgi:hypothetical protein